MVTTFRLLFGWRLAHDGVFSGGHVLRESIFSRSSLPIVEPFLMHFTNYDSANSTPRQHGPSFVSIGSINDIPLSSLPILQPPPPQIQQPTDYHISTLSNPTPPSPSPLSPTSANPSSPRSTRPPASPTPPSQFPKLAPPKPPLHGTQTQHPRPHHVHLALPSRAIRPRTASRYLL